MGPEQIQQVQQAVSVSQADGGFALEWVLRVIILPMIFGGYVYTWLSTNSLRKELRYMKDNHLTHINEEIAAIKAKLE